MKLARILLSLAWLPCLAAHAQVRPIWSLPLGETVADPQRQRIDGAHLLADGSGYFFGESLGFNSLRLSPDGSRLIGQAFRDYPTEVLAVSNERVLFSWNSGGAEMGAGLRDLHGTVRWLQLRAVSAARFLPDGDVVMLSGHQVLRVRGHDGVITWSREMLDIHPYARSGQFSLGGDVDTQIVVAGSLQFLSPSSRAEGWLAAIDPVDGEIQWARRVDTDHESVDKTQCPVVVDSDANLTIWKQREGDGEVPTIQLRRRSDGSLLWSARLPAQGWFQGCDAALDDTRAYLALGASGGVSLHGLSRADGTIDWNHRYASGSEGRLLAGASGLMSATRELDAQGQPVTLIQHHRKQDGQTTWSLRAAQTVGWQRVGDALHLASVLTDTDGDQAVLEVRDFATGTLRTSADAGLTRRQMLASGAGLIGDTPCVASVSAANMVTLQCLDGMNGTPHWERELTHFGPEDRIFSLTFARLTGGRFGLRIGYRRTMGAAAVELYELASVAVADGHVDWTRADFQSYPILLGTDDGGVVIFHVACATQPGCGGRQPMLERLSAVEGARLWSRPAPAHPLAQRGDDLFLVSASILGSPAFRLDARTGSDGWAALPLPQTTLLQSGQLTDGGHLVVELDWINGSSRRIEVRGYDPATGAERWIHTPALPDARTSYNGDVSTIGGEIVLATGLLRSTTTGLGAWLAAIHAQSGAVQWERQPTPGRDSSRSMRVVGPPTSRAVWLSERRFSRSALERKALTQLDSQDGSLGSAFQYASSRDLPPSDPSELAEPEGILADGSVLASAWREVDGYSLPVLQRWPAPAGADANLVLALESPSPVLGHGPSAMVDLLIENRSMHSVAGIRPGFAPGSGGQAARSVSCSAASGDVRCDPEGDAWAGMKLSLGPGAVARVRYEVSGPNYIPARSTNNGTVYFHIDLPYNVGDDLGDNTVEVEIWLGGTSNGFE